jgi:hypothetical protein
MTKPSTTEYASRRRLYQVGAAAALIAAVVFRRNMGAEMTMFFGAAPNTAAGWFTLLQTNSLLGIISLNFFDIIDYTLVGIMFVALYVALRRTNKIYAGIAASLCLVGIVVYVVSDTSFTIASLNSQYARALTAEQKSALLTSTQAVLTKGAPGAGYQGVGGLISLVLIATAGLMVSSVMLRSKIFNRTTGYIGIIAGILDFAYLGGLKFLPVSSFDLWSSVFIGGAGLLLMIWHLLVGTKLYQLSRVPQIRKSVNQRVKH